MFRNSSLLMTVQYNVTTFTKNHLQCEFSIRSRKTSGPNQIFSATKACKSIV
uniref:Uncharacterized protein n=1 Tax=Anguilla anguilla TaxID=7936 RepID=A0A0E9S5B4_ANGAN